MFIANVIVFICFGITFALSKFTGIDWLKFLPGLLLIYYLPGRNFNSIIFKKRTDIRWYLRLSLDIISSLSLLSLSFLVIGNLTNVGFAAKPLILLTLSINLVLAVCETIFCKSYLNLKNQFGSFLSGIKNTKKIIDYIKQNKIMLIIFLIPIALFLLRLVLNPYVFDIDSLLYYKSFQGMIQTGKDIYQFFIGREAFPFLVMTTHYLGGLGYISIFKFFTPVIFYLSSFSLLALGDLKPKKYLTFLSYLLIVISPMLIIMNETVRPETINIAFTIPILVLTFLCIKNNEKIFALLLLLYGLATYRFHESGLLLLVTILITIIIFLVKNYKDILKLMINNPKITIAIVIPYLLLLSSKLSLIKSFFSQSELSSWLISNVVHGLSHIGWRWWFLNNCITADGANLSWPGITAVIYYLYSGIILLILAIIVFVIYLVLKKKKQINTLSIVPILPILGLLGMYLSFAELLPRLGIVLHPNRSWPHIALAIVVLLTILIGALDNQKIQKVYLRWTYILVILAVISGAIGTTVGSTFMGAMVLPQEKDAIKELKNLPSDSLVLSTQRNDNLVRIYGNKEFLEIPSSNFKAENFNQNVIDKLNTYGSDENSGLLFSIIINKESEERIYNGENLLNKEIKTTKIADNDQKIELLKLYNKELYDQIVDKISKNKNLTNNHIYFIYSFAKLDHGIINSREWWRESADAKNYSFFSNYTDRVVAKNKDFILIKIN